jgi:hypothetical protein
MSLVALLVAGTWSPHPPCAAACAAAAPATASARGAMALRGGRAVDVCRVEQPSTLRERRCRRLHPKNTRGTAGTDAAADAGSSQRGVGWWLRNRRRRMGGGGRERTPLRRGWGWRPGHRARGCNSNRQEAAPAARAASGISQQHSQALIVRNVCCHAKQQGRTPLSRQFVRGQNIQHRCNLHRFWPRTNCRL